MGKIQGACMGHRRRGGGQAGLCGPHDLRAGRSSFPRPLAGVWTGQEHLGSLVRHKT